jgi:hypothetical protein
MALTQISTQGIKDGTITGTDLATNVDLVDNQKLRLGTGNDLQIYHDGSASFIQDTGTGNIKIISNKLEILNAANNEYMAVGNQDGNFELYFDGTKKFETTTNGGSLTGDWNVSNDFFWFDNGEAVFGSGGDLKIYHDGTDSIIKDTRDSGTLRIHADSIAFNDKDVSETMLLATADGSVNLYYNGSKKFETTSVGAKVTGRLGVEIAPSTAVEVQLDAFVATGNDDASDWGADGIFQLTHQGTQATNNEVLLLGAVSGAVGQIASGFGFGRENTSNWGTYISFKTHSTSTSNIDELIERWKITSAGHFENNSDSIRIKLGASDDLQIYHNGNHSFIEDSGTGNLEISSSKVAINNAANNANMATFTDGGAVTLYHNGTKKFETVAGGVKTNDNNYMGFGNSNDLKIYHDGNNNLILGSPTVLIKNNANTESYIRCNENAQVELLL